MDFETLVFSPFNHLTRLVARENFIILLYGVYKWVVNIEREVLLVSLLHFTLN
jgi:hypothetical protein